MRALPWISCLLILLALPAHSAVIRVTFSGIVTFGLDERDLFGLSGNLVGQPAEMSFLYDTTLGMEFHSSNERSVSGGRLYGVASPVFATITLNRVVTVSGTEESIAHRETDTSQPFQTLDFVNNDTVYGPGNSLHIDRVAAYCIGPRHSFSISLARSLVAPTADISCAGSYSMIDYDAPTNSVIRTVFEMSTERFTFETLVADVPLPASGLMLAGGLLGLVPGPFRRLFRRA